MFKKMFLLLLIVAPLSVLAQEKFGYVNANEVFAKMPELKEVESKIATKRETIQKNAAAIEATYTATLEKFKASTEEPTESILMDRQKELDTLQERYQTYTQSSSAELQKEQETLIAPVQQKLLKAIKDVGDESGYTYIFDRASMHYVSDKAIDATKAVKAKLGIVD